MKIEFEIPDDTFPRFHDWINWMSNAYLNSMFNKKDVELVAALLKLKEKLDEINTDHK
jgi:hypothetical protein